MIRDKVQAKVAQAFNGKLADAVKSFTCTKIIESGDFDYTTQTYPEQVTEEYSGRGVFGSYKKDLVKPADYQTEDLKLTALQNEVVQTVNGENVVHVPQVGDVLNTPYGDVEIITPINQDPTGAVWILQLRKVTE